MARHTAPLADDPITVPIPIPAPPVVIARPRWPIAALVLTLLAGIVIIAGATLLTVQLVHPAAVAAPSPTAPLPATNPAPSPAPAAPSTQLSAATPATSSVASSTSSGSDEAPVPGSLRVGGPSPTGWTDGNGNPTSDPFEELCDVPAPDSPGSCADSDATSASSDTDQQFLGELKSRGIVTPGTSTELQGAATLCQHLTAGSTLTHEANKLMAAPYHYSAALAGYFAGQAVRDYCPSFSNQLK